MNGIPFNRRRAAEIRSRSHKVVMRRACIKSLVTRQEDCRQRSAPGTFDRLFDRFHAEAAQVTAATDAQSAALREASRLTDQARAAHQPRPKLTWRRRLYRRFVQFDVLGVLNSVWD